MEDQLSQGSESLLVGSDRTICELLVVCPLCKQKDWHKKQPILMILDVLALPASSLGGRGHISTSSLVTNGSSQLSF